MKANAPEKIYITPHFERRWFTKEIDDVSVEYTRTDAFIKKACDAYCKACNKPSYSVPIPFCRRRCEFYSNFIKNIKL